MKVVISGRVADSAGALEAGRIEFAQAQRFDNGELLVTGSIAVAQVVAGELRRVDGLPFTLPSNPEGTAVRVREILGGETFEWWTAVPDAESVEYRDLPLVESGDVPASVWGPPPWLAEVAQMRDEMVAAIESGVEVAEALGGLAGIQGLVDSAEAAAGQSATSASASSIAAGEASSAAARAESAAGSAAADAAAGVLSATKDEADRAEREADRAQAVADSIDMTAINDRLDGMDTSIADKASKQYVDDAVAGVKPASVDLVSAIRWPLYISHRGAPRVYPEHSIEGYRASYAAGFTPEADVRALVDGTLVCIHDATTNGTMDVSKTVSAMSVSEWRAARVKPPKQGDRIAGSGCGTPVFFEDYLDEFGGKIVLFPEVKVTGAAATAAIKAIVDRGLQGSVVLQSGDLNTCKEAAQAGLHALMLSNTQTPASMVAAGIKWVGVSAAATNTYVNQCKAAGMRVIAWTMNTKAEADAQLARGADGVFSDDPWEVSRLYTPETSLDLSNGFLAPGMLHSRGNSGGAAGTGQKVLAENGTLLFTLADGDGHNCLKLGSFGQNLGGSVRVRLWVMAEGKPASAAESTWLFGVYLGNQDGDLAVNEEPGKSQFRLAMVRRNGQKNAYERRTKAGSTASLGSVAAPTTPYAKPGGRSVPMLFEVDFTPTSVAIRNLTLNDTDLEVSATALTTPNAYITLGVNGAIGRVWGVEVSTP